MGDSQERKKNMEKKQHILTLIIILAVIGIAVIVASIIYDERVKENKKAVESISAPKVEVTKNDNEEEQAKEEENLPEDNSNSESDYVGEEDKESQEQVKEEQKESKQTDDEKAIELAKIEWGEDDTVSFSVENKEDTKIYVSVNQNGAVIQWYVINTSDWTIKKY